MITEVQLEDALGYFLMKAKSYSVNSCIAELHTLTNALIKDGERTWTYLEGVPDRDGQWEVEVHANRV